MSIKVSVNGVNAGGHFDGQNGLNTHSVLSVHQMIKGPLTKTKSNRTESAVSFEFYLCLFNLNSILTGNDCLVLSFNT